MICKEEDCEEEEQWEPVDENLDKLPPRFKISREQDMHNYIFHVGFFFESVEVLIKAIQSYSYINRQDIKLSGNHKKRVNDKCSVGCSWNLWASYSRIRKCFMIKKFWVEQNHSCSRTFKVHAFTSN
jgi:hypothetical protein